MRRTLAMLLALGGLTPAIAGNAPVPAVVTSTGYLYLPGDESVPEAPLQIEQGTPLVHANTDPLMGWHALVSADTDANGTALFSAEQIGPGQTIEVKGVPGRGPGTYLFYCSNHPDMTGYLTVTP